MSNVGAIVVKPKVSQQPKLERLAFPPLDITGKNYLTGILDAKMHLQVVGLEETIVEDDNTNTSNRNKAKTLKMLRRHLHEDLKSEYLNVEDPKELWRNLKDRFEHLRAVILPKARYDWIHLRLQDFQSICAYNSIVYHSSSQLKLCGEMASESNMLEKTFSTFHATNVLLQQKYLEKSFKKYSNLISCLLVTEQNNELLMKNHDLRPIGSAPVPKTNAVVVKNFGPRCGRKRRRGYHDSKYINFKTRVSKDVANDQKSFTKGGSECHSCGMKGHWSKTYRMPRHPVDAYQTCIKNNEKEKVAEANLVQGTRLWSEISQEHPGVYLESTSLELDDFLVGSEKQY